MAEDDSCRILEMDRTDTAMSFMSSMGNDYTNELDDDDNDDDNDDDADDADDEDDNGDDDDDEGYDSGDDLANSFDNDPILQENPHAILNELGVDKNSLVYQVMELWLKCKKPLIHDYYLVGYILAPQPTISQDATLRMTESTVYTMQ